MSQTATCRSTSKSVSSVNPLEELAAFLSADMAKVNALILERMQSDIPLIPQLAGYLIAAGGKRMRPLMTLASARLFDEVTRRPYPLAAAVEFIHSATLLHDDVVDESDQRRGQASANALFGNQSSVLVGDFLFSKAFQLMVEDGSLDVLHILSSASAVIAEGEVLQLSIQNVLETRIDQYIRVISAKTAALFAAACEIGPVVTGQSPEIRQAMRDYGQNVGLAFQIADDLLDYCSNTDDLGKTVGDDFREGKMTAPVIFAYQYACEAEQSDDMAFWNRVFVDKAIDEQDLSTALGLIGTTGADQKTLSLAHHYVDLAIRALAPIPDHPIKPILVRLADYALSRKY